MPVFVARQYVRHRMQNLNEVSARYTELPDEFYMPKKWRVQDTKNKQGSVQVETTDHWHDYQTDIAEEAYKFVYDSYQELLAQGVARELARIVLPVGIYTEIYACWDMKNLLHFITLREDSHAQYEIQQYGIAIKQICREFCPWLIEAYERYKWELIDIQAEGKV